MDLLDNPCEYGSTVGKDWTLVDIVHSLSLSTRQRWRADPLWSISGVVTSVKLGGCMSERGRGMCRIKSSRRNHAEAARDEKSATLTSSDSDS